MCFRKEKPRAKIERGAFGRWGSYPVLKQTTVCGGNYPFRECLNSDLARRLSSEHFTEELSKQRVDDFFDVVRMDTHFLRCGCEVAIVPVAIANADTLPAQQLLDQFAQKQDFTEEVGDESPALGS